MDDDIASVAASVPPIVPVGHRLLHVGVPGTGSVPVQRAAATRRDLLLQAGVCFPGGDTDQREAVAALIRRRRGWSGPGSYVPAARLGSELLAELESRPRARGFVSDESVADCSETQVRRLREALGPDLHVVMVLGGLADLLGPGWQSYLTAGGTVAYEPWLAQVLASSAGRSVPRSLVRRLDQAGLLERWLRILGADRLTVVIADRRHPRRVHETFEALLGLPAGALAPGPAETTEGRELTLAEAELIRALNRSAAIGSVPWPDYDVLVRAGSVAGLQRDRSPAADEPDLSLPAWAAERAATAAAHDADVVRASGCALVGDVAALTRPVPVRDGAVPELTQIPVEVAAAGLAGMLTATVGRSRVKASAGSPAPHEAADRVAAVTRLAVSRLQHEWATWRPRVRASLSPLTGPPPSAVRGVSGPASPAERP